MTEELLHFLGAFFHGVLWAAVYDTLAGWRERKNRQVAKAGMADFLFWLAAAFGTFACIYRLTGGSLRGYLLAAMGIGVFAWKSTLGKGWRRFLCFLGRKIAKIRGAFCRKLKKDEKNVRKRLKTARHKGKIK